MTLLEALRLNRGLSKAAHVLVAVAVCGGLAACGGGGTGTTTPTPTPVPAPVPVPPPTLEAATCDAERTGAVDPGAIGVDSRSLRPEARIVGGVNAAIDTFPFAAALAFERLDGSLFQYCGGSLIAPDWVLTAAHCEVRNTDKVILGRQDLTTSDGEVLGVDFVLTHSAYNPDTQENDIALVKLASASGQGTVGLIDAGDTGSQPGDDSTVIGWGRLTEGGATSNLLQEVTIPIVSNATCQAGYAPNITILPTMLCAGLEAGQKDSCQGDSGGPLLVGGTGAWQQTGVVSFGIGCARPGKFGVYTRVSRYLDWVDACQANPPS